MSNEAAEDFGILLNIAFNTFKDGLSEHLAAAGYSDIGPSFGYIFRYLEEAPQNLRHVADRLGITPQGALKIVNDMVRKGYVLRHSDGVDGRVKQLALTPRAIKAIAAARRFHKQFEDQLAEELGANRVAGGRKLLELIVSRRSPDSLAKLRPT